MKKSVLLFLAFGCAGLVPLSVRGQQEDPPGDLSLEDLLNVQVNAAATYAQTVSEVAASVTVITREEIQRFGYRTLGEALSQVRGFYGTYDRNYFYLGVRGFGRPGDYNNRVHLLIDGRVSNDAFYGAATLGSDFALSLNMVERIEVIRGPGSTLYGSSAMFAVINVVTREGRDVGGTELQAEAGSFGLKRASAVFGRVFDNGFSLMASGDWYDADGQDHFFPEFDDPETNNGVAEGRDFERSFGGYVKAGYGPFTFTGHAATREKGVPTASWYTLFNEELNTTDSEGSLHAKFEKDLDHSRNLVLRADMGWYDYDGVYPYEEEYQEFDRDVARWETAEARFRWDLTEANRLILGSEVRRSSTVRYKVWSDEEVIYDRDSPFTVFSAYAHDEVDVTPKVTITGGARIDYHTEVGTSFSPRFAAVFHPSEDLTLKALFGEAFRAPNEFERHYDDGLYNIANPDLKPERIRTLEAVVEKRIARHFYATASFFDFKVRDIIEEMETEEEYYQFQNYGTVSATGVEAEVAFMSGSGVSWNLSHVYQVAKDRVEETDLTNSPQHSTKARISYRLSPAVTLSADAVHEGSRMTLWEDKTDPFTVANLTLSTQQLLDPLSVSVSVRNIFDEDYVHPGGWEQVLPTIKQDGRSLAVRVGVIF